MSFHPAPRGVYSRGGHTKAASSVDDNWYKPPPLSIKDTLAIHLRFARAGLSDACKLDVMLDTLATNKVMQANTLKSTVLQGVVLFSALVIEPFLEYATSDDPSSRPSRGGTVYILFHLLWLYPLALASVVYSGLLKPPDLLGGSASLGPLASGSTSAATGRRPGASTAPKQEYRGITAYVVGESVKVLVLINYFLFVFLLRFIPVFGRPLSFLYSCIVNSYYCYEQQWLKLNKPFHDRLKNLDSRWAYFTGFGLPITFLSWWFRDPVVNLALFALFFPLFQITSTTSLAQPIDPSLPTSSMSVSFAFLPQSKSQGSFSIAAAEGGEENRGRPGNPLVPVRIQVLILADRVYGFLNRWISPSGNAKKKKDAGGGGAGWRTDGYYGRPPQPPPSYTPDPSYPYPSTSSSPHHSSYASSAPYGEVAGGGVGISSYNTATATSASPSSFANATPPRRGHHPQTDSVIGIGGEYVDRNLDSLINQASRRKKGD